MTVEKLMEINERILHEYDKQIEQDDEKDDSSEGPSDNENKGTLMLDATCAPSEIKYPQDTALLNDARVKSEKIIDNLCEANRLKKPRMYRKKARKDYLAIAKRKKKSAKIIRKAIRKQLSYVGRNIGYTNGYQKNGIILDGNQAIDFYIIQRIQEQQEYMYDHRIHTVRNRIVSFNQAYLRPIVRGKAKTPTEFGAKLDISQANGFVRIERLSFDAFNESEDLIVAIERYYERTGYYPERVLVDQIYRTRKNR